MTLNGKPIKLVNSSLLLATGLCNLDTLMIKSGNLLGGSLVPLVDKEKKRRRKKQVEKLDDLTSKYDAAKVFEVAYSDEQITVDADGAVKLACIKFLHENQASSDMNDV